MSEQAISLEPGKVSTVMEWGQPTTPTKVSTFLGLAGYYRRFIQVSSKIVGPLTNFTRKGLLFIWNEMCQQAFEELKKILTTTPILALPQVGVDYRV